MVTREEYYKSKRQLVFSGYYALGLTEPEREEVEKRVDSFTTGFKGVENLEDIKLQCLSDCCFCQVRNFEVWFKEVIERTSKLSSHGNGYSRFDLGHTYSDRDRAISNYSVLVGRFKTFQYITEDRWKEAIKQLENLKTYKA